MSSKGGFNMHPGKFPFELPNSMALEIGVHSINRRKLNRRKKNKKCFIEGCSCNKVINSHVFSKALLKASFENNLSFSTLFGLGKTTPKRILTFNGICSKHDNEIFNPIDGKFTYEFKNDYTDFLLSYRTVLFVYFDLIKTIKRLKSNDIEVFENQLKLLQNIAVYMERRRKTKKYHLPYLCFQVKQDIPIFFIDYLIEDKCAFFVTGFTSNDTLTTLFTPVIFDKKFKHSAKKQIEEFHQYFSNKTNNELIEITKMLFNSALYKIADEQYFEELLKERLNLVDFIEKDFPFL